MNYHCQGIASIVNVGYKGNNYRQRSCLAATHPVARQDSGPTKALAIIVHPIFLAAGNYFLYIPHQHYLQFNHINDLNEWIQMLISCSR